MICRLPLIALLCVAISPSLLMAQPPGRGGGPGGMRGGGPPTDMIIQVFTQADANSDGMVTKAELTAVLENQGGNQRGAGGPPQRGNGGQGERPGNRQAPTGERGGGGGEHGGHHGPPPQPGQVLPEQITESLNLNAKQTRMLAALQADVDKRLAAILTNEQHEQLKNAHPPHGPDHGGGGAGERGQTRPQRPE